MMIQKRLQSLSVLCLALLVLFLLLGASLSLAGKNTAVLSPQQQLKNGIDEFLKVISDESLKTEAGKKILEEKLVRMFKQHFDLTYTSQLCLGRHWRKISPAEKDEFVGLFSDLLKSTYIGRVDEYSGEKVNYKKQLLKGKKALVKTVVVSKDKEIPVDYKMINRDGSWRVYDIIIEGVSMVRNYRSQFSSILQKKKFADLLNQIRDKIAQNQAEKDAVKEPKKG